MSTPRCLFNSAVALRRVFIAHALPAGEATSRSLRPALPLLRPYEQRRTKRYKPVGKPMGKPMGNDNKQESQQDALADSTMIYLRNEDGGLSEPVKKTAVMRSLDRQTQILQLLAASADTGAGRYPVYRVADRRAEEEKERAKAREARQELVGEKEVVIRWAIEAHDLAMKMKQMRKFLDKGFRVKLTLTRQMRRSKQEATKEAAKNLMAHVDEVIASIPGAKEIKNREGDVGGVLRIVLQGQREKKGAKTETAPPPEGEGVADVQ